MDQKRTQPAHPKKPELRPDGWERFEKAVDIAARTPAIRKETPSQNPSIVKDKRKP
jgi:hypothetical protein